MMEVTTHGSRSAVDLGCEDPNLLPDLTVRIIDAMHGAAVDFDDVPIAPGTPFQRAIWRATRMIDVGSVLTYGELATRVGRPAAARATGQAMRRNPQPIITPCHRVVSSTGLGGFGGEGGEGTERSIKTLLLQAEGAALPG
ncbi:MAG: cysteine methyltransferase [Phycisphaerae bacterium]|nr:cysteine methyltransferase [Phycisphaerae bacterium]